MKWQLNQSTGFGEILSGIWVNSNKCVPALMYAPARDIENTHIPYVYRPFTPSWRWVGNAQAVILIEKMDDPEMSLLIERRFIHAAGSVDRAKAEGGYEGVFAPGSSGQWRRAILPELN
jgi:hypothetical protein